MQYCISNTLVIICAKYANYVKIKEFLTSNVLRAKLFSFNYCICNMQIYDLCIYGIIQSTDHVISYIQNNVFEVLKMNFDVYTVNKKKKRKHF